LTNNFFGFGCQVVDADRTHSSTSPQQASGDGASLSSPSPHPRRPRPVILDAHPLARHVPGLGDITPAYAQLHQSKTAPPLQVAVEYLQAKLNLIAHPVDCMGANVFAWDPDDVALQLLIHVCARRDHARRRRTVLHSERARRWVESCRLADWS